MQRAVVLPQVWRLRCLVSCLDRPEPEDEKQLRCDVIAVASNAHVAQTLLREQNRLLTRLEPFRDSAFESGHDKEAFPHFVSAGGARWQTSGRDELLTPLILIIYFFFFSWCTR